MQAHKFGCDSLSRVFTDNHYTNSGALTFPNKKARLHSAGKSRTVGLFELLEPQTA